MAFKVCSLTVTNDTGLIFPDNEASEVAEEDVWILSLAGISDIKCHADSGHYLFPGGYHFYSLDII